MDLGTDYCWQVMPLALLWSLTQKRLTMLEVVGSYISCCLPRQMSPERKGEAFIRKAGVNACQV